MKLTDFIENSDLKSKTQEEQAALLCYYHHKNTGESCFDMQAIGALFTDAGFKPINATRIKNALINKGKMRLVDGLLNTLVFNTVTLENLDKEYASFWTDYIDSTNELIDEGKFCGKRGYLDKIVKQINCCYREHCFDACAVVMRRLFEIVLVLAYQHHNIDDEIKDSSGKGYQMLEAIVGNAQNNRTLKLSRIKNEFDTFRNLGNSSAHSITYTASAKDIDDVKMNYRIAIEELYNKAGLL